jgi:mannose-6-phosphate isomerase-like protein (cupin superfamily)
MLENTGPAGGAEPARSAPYLLRDDEGPALWFLDNLVTVKAGVTDTGGALTVAHIVNPPGFAPPLHRHLVEDEMFYVLSGAVEYSCADQLLHAGPGDFVLLPKGLPHTFRVGPEQPLYTLQLTTPGGFENFAAAVGAPAPERRLPDPGPVDPAALGHAAALHQIEILGPPPPR